MKSMVIWRLQANIHGHHGLLHHTAKPTTSARAVPGLWAVRGQQVVVPSAGFLLLRVAGLGSAGLGGSASWEGAEGALLQGRHTSAWAQGWRAEVGVTKMEGTKRFFHGCRDGPSPALEGRRRGWTWWVKGLCAKARVTGFWALKFPVLSREGIKILMLIYH